MFLKRLVLVNWGNVPDTQIDFGPINLLSGANGSGKTTVADAVQTVMTAAHESLFHFNPGQDESTQRGRGGKRVRTLASYVLGCDDGSYARTQPTDGYIAATFHPTPAEAGVAFTALVGVRAWLDESGKQPLAREDSCVFFILPEVGLSLAELRREQEDGLHVVLLDELQQTLITGFGKRAVERYDQKRAYLRRLYGALRGRPDSVSEREALGAARAFSRFMAYKPVSSISQFVADEVLERKDLGEAIRSVSGQLKTIHSMEREAQDLKSSSLLLERAGREAQGFLAGWIDLKVLGYREAWRLQHQVQAALLAAIEDRDATDRDLTENAHQLALNDERRRQAHERLVHLSAQRFGVPALRQKDALEKERGELQAQLTGRARDVLEQSRQADENARAARVLSDLLASPVIAEDLPQVADLASRSRVREVLECLKDDSRIDLTRLLQKDLTDDLAALEKHLDDARQAQRAQNELAGHFRGRDAQGRSRRDQAADLDFRRRERFRQLTESVKQKEAEITRLTAKQVLYPAWVERALGALRAQCPEADARVLCDYVEVHEPRWQSAIEGYLGGTRFDILVDPAHEAEAVRIVRALPGRDNRARIVQGARALRDAAHVKVPSGSILDVLAIQHAVARAYLTARYAGVLRVEGTEELKDSVRGVTAEGMGSGGYAMFRCDMPDADLVFGGTARERALAAKRVEAEKLHAARNEVATLMQQSAQLLSALDAIAPVGYADALEALLALQRGILRVEQLLARLDLGDNASLDRELAAARKLDDELREAAAVLNQALGDLRKQRERAGQRIKALGLEKDEVQNAITGARAALEKSHALWPVDDLDRRLEDAEAAARNGDARCAADEEAGLRKSLDVAQRAVTSVLMEHNHQSRSAGKIPDTSAAGDDEETRFAKLAQLHREIDQLYNQLRNNVLVEKHEQLKGLKTDFNRIFVQNLCHEIGQSLRTGRQQIELLNKELTGHRFGSDRERFRFEQEDIPEFREYKGFLKEVAEAPGLADGAGLFETELSARSAAVRDKLMTLLLSEDEQRSLAELERIADYRNYHRYEIYKDVEGKPPIALSEYGTGSGGQLETPAYIIRSASITSAWRYAEGTTHLRMVLVDEAFSKMDEGRSREVIDYLTRTLGLQLVFIMPTSKCGPFMDLVSNELVFAKVPSPQRGQLRTRVLLDRRAHNQERIGELWKQHRRSVREQAELDFMADVLGEDASAAQA